MTTKNPSHPEKRFVLKISCPAAAGIVAGVSTFLFERGCYFEEINQFDDTETQQLFMRMMGTVQDVGKGGDDVLDKIRTDFPKIADTFQMQWELYDSSVKPKVIIMVGKSDHCINDLLYRLNKKELNMDVVAIVSNHKDARPIAEREGIRFVHLPITKETKPQQERALLDIIEEAETDLVVLARYMQILSDDLAKTLEGRAINIHHSFLPGFKGAKPYHQAHNRGVKLIGATAHYVNGDLDEGPIIEQVVQNVDHSYSPDDLVRVGRDSETRALARAVKYHLEHRVFLDGRNKTVVFK